MGSIRNRTSHCLWSSSMGLRDCPTQKVWAEQHKPSSSGCWPQSDENAWKDVEKLDSPQEFENVHYFKMAMALLEGGIHRASPWKMAFKILHFFLQSINCRENDLSSKASKLPHLANFVKKILRGNTWNREENFFFLPGFDCQMVH